MRSYILPRKPMTIAVAVLALLFLAYLGLKSHAQNVSLERENLLGQAIEKTKASKSYRYRIDSRLAGEDGANYMSRVTGEQAGDRVHVKGTLLNSAFELVQVGDESYLKDQVTGGWINFKGNRLAQTELFVNEITPLAILNFKDVPEMNYKGKEKKNVILEIRPVVQNPYLETLFTDHRYRIAVDPKKKLITKVHMEATSRENEKQKLVIDIAFWDFDKDIRIEAPR
ncbi:MAG: hypothetical protein QME76_12960 [Bacillota bacterium]|nr:hypothetical protein [Bacillota bacterium]